jgi:hypothetical protein
LYRIYVGKSRLAHAVFGVYGQGVSKDGKSVGTEGEIPESDPCICHQPEIRRKACSDTLAEDTF